MNYNLAILTAPPVEDRMLAEYLVQLQVNLIKINKALEDINTRLSKLESI